MTCMGKMLKKRALMAGRRKNYGDQTLLHVDPEVEGSKHEEP
jgi:hypothetical protein